MAGQKGRRSAHRYRETVVQAIRDHGLKLKQILECDQSLEGGRAAASKLAGKSIPSAILCINDFTAIGLMAALHELGIRVPEDVSVIGCEDIYLSSFVNPPLTTVRLDRMSLGKLAFSVLSTMPQRDHERNRELKTCTHLIVRDSTARRRTRSSLSELE